MEKLKRARAPIRGLITRTINEVETELAKEVKDILTLKTKYERLNELQSRIQEIDQAIYNEMLDEVQITDEERNKEIEATEDIYTEIVKAKLKIDREICQQERKEKHNEEIASTILPIIPHKRQFKLPKIELQKFSGKILDWLGWWAQFEKIHKDEELHVSDNFQYLIQSMETNSKGDEIVKGFPATEENYPKVIAMLRERFGNKKILMQVYMGNST